MGRSAVAILASADVVTMDRDHAIRCRPVRPSIQLGRGTKIEKDIESIQRLPDVDHVPLRTVPRSVIPILMDLRSVTEAISHRAPSRAGLSVVLTYASSRTTVLFYPTVTLVDKSTERTPTKWE